jgi:hypothetical protein
MPCLVVRREQVLKGVAVAALDRGTPDILASCRGVCCRRDLALAPCGGSRVVGASRAAAPARFTAASSGGVSGVLWRCHCPPPLPDCRLPSPSLSTVRTPRCAPSRRPRKAIRGGTGYRVWGMVLHRGGGEWRSGGADREGRAKGESMFFRRN